MLDVENELAMHTDQPQAVIAADLVALNLTPSSKQQQLLSSADEIGSRKKTKKRDRSPTSAGDSNNVQGVSQQSANPTQLAAQTSAQSSSNAAATVNPKKEKQRPETWNKIEQQIFFNALRQVLRQK
jgi:hypothetical protein